MPLAVTGATLLGGVYYHASYWASMDFIQRTSKGIPYTDDPVANSIAYALSLRKVVGSDSTLLCDDPKIAVMLGKRPVLLDPYIFTVLSDHGVVDVSPLVARIENHAFPSIVLVVHVSRDPESKQISHWLPARVLRAIGSAYRHGGQFGRYHLYLPRENESAKPPGRLEREALERGMNH